MRFYLLRIIPVFLTFIFSLSACSQPSKIVDDKSKKTFQKAKQAYQERHNEEAMKLLVKTLERSPDYPEAHMLKFQLHQEQKEFEQATTELEEVVRISPNFFPNAHLFLGRIYLSQGKYKEATERLEYFLHFKNNDAHLIGEANMRLENCYFAAEAMKNPVPFDPKSMGDNINSANSEYFPTLTANDQLILFTRRMKVANTQREQEDFYLSEKKNGQWQPAVPLKMINTSGNEGAPSIAPDGELIVFTACEDVYGDYGGKRKGLGSCDLFYTFREGARWTVPRNMGKNINTRNWETQPSLSADGKTLYFVRAQNKRGSIHNLDIYKSVLDVDGAWGVAEKLSNVINTSGDESSVLIHPDGQTLYFTSDGHTGMGGEDIFVSRKDKEGHWSTPVNLGYPINTYKNENSLVVSADGKLAYFASDRENGAGGLDLYQFELYEDARPMIVNYMEGYVFDQQTEKAVQAHFELIDIASGDVVIDSYSNVIDGKFLVSLPAGKDYALNVSAPGYLFYSDHFSMKAGSMTKPFLIDVPLSKAATGATLVLKNMFFDTDKYDLKSESNVEIAKIKEFLVNNPTLNIEISGHTDNVGNEGHNKTLSVQRATAVKQKLVAIGVAEERISVQGYGAAKPIGDNNTEEGRAINRRTEMKIM